MATNSPGYGITIRVEGVPSSNPVAEITTIVTNQEATITAIDVVESLYDRVVVDVTCDTMNSEHAERISSALEKHSSLFLLCILCNFYKMANTQCANK